MPTTALVWDEKLFETAVLWGKGLVVPSLSKLLLLKWLSLSIDGMEDVEAGAMLISGCNIKVTEGMT